MQAMVTADAPGRGVPEHAGMPKGGADLGSQAGVLLRLLTCMQAYMPPGAVSGMHTATPPGELMLPSSLADVYSRQPACAGASRQEREGACSC